MGTPAKLISVIIAAGIYDVWLVRPKKKTRWRGGGARSLEREFAAYGLPTWFMWTVGALKLSAATTLLVGLRVPSVTRPAALGMAALMAGAVAMHVKVKDPVERAVPALAMLALSLLLAELGGEPPERARRARGESAATEARARIVAPTGAAAHA